MNGDILLTLEDFSSSIVRLEAFRTQAPIYCEGKVAMTIRSKGRDQRPNFVPTLSALKVRGCGCPY